MGRGTNWNKARLTTRIHQQKACALAHRVDDVLTKERLLKRPPLKPKKWQEADRVVQDKTSLEPFKHNGVLYHPRLIDDNGSVRVEGLELPRLSTFGDTLDEARERAHEAIDQLVAVK